MKISILIKSLWYAVILFAVTSESFVNIANDTCTIWKCSSELKSCLSDRKCAIALGCNAQCVSKSNADSCNLLCELNYGYNNTGYSSLLSCLVESGCLPVSPMDGICLADDSQADKSLVRIDQIDGQWWVLKGLNCGQDDIWTGGFDYFPCQYDYFLSPKIDSGGQWTDRISYCGGAANVCNTDYVYTNANATITLASPGVILHSYLDAPLLPQIEHWRVLSRHHDWMLFIYCGETPAGPYAGGSVVSRTARSITAIPPDIELDFVETAKKFGFDYYEMCISDTSSCTN